MKAEYDIRHASCRKKKRSGNNLNWHAGVICQAMLKVVVAHGLGSWLSGIAAPVWLFTIEGGGRKGPSLNY